MKVYWAKDKQENLFINNSLAEGHQGNFNEFEMLPCPWNANDGDG